MAVEDLSPPPKKEDAKFDNWMYRLWKRARVSVDYTVVGATDPILATTGTGTIGISHATSGVIPGTYGGTLGLPQVVVNTYGHVIAGTSFPLQATTPVLIGSNAGTYTWGHATSGVTTGTYGAAGIIAAVSLDTYGHVRAVTTFAVAAAGTDVTGADVVGTSPILLGGTTTNAVLRPFTVHHATSGVLPSTYGGTFGKSQLVVNTYGHVTSGTNIADMPQRIQNGNYTLVLGDGDDRHLPCYVGRHPRNLRWNTRPPASGRQHLRPRHRRDFVPAPGYHSRPHRVERWHLYMGSCNLRRNDGDVWRRRGHRGG